MQAQSKRRERLGIVEMLEAIGEMLEAKQSWYLAQIVKHNATRTMQQVHSTLSTSTFRLPNKLDARDSSRTGLHPKRIAS